MRLKLIFAAFLFLALQKVNSQTASYTEEVVAFKNSFNEKDAKAIFGMWNERMQNAVSLTQTESIINYFYENFGKMETVAFSEKQDALEIYIAHFEKGKQYLNVVLDAERRFAGFRFLPFEEPLKFERNTTVMTLPFKGEWFTFWGGDTKAQNYHVTTANQRGAFDFFIIDKNNKSYQRSGTRNEDYYAFGKPLYAVCSATVVDVITGVEDNKPGEMNPLQTHGNSVMLKTENDEYIVYSHFEKETIVVKEGDTVQQGQYLGNCGNSGNSSEPHLHFSLQDGPNRISAMGAKTYFAALYVNGEFKADYSPVKGDKITKPE